MSNILIILRDKCFSLKVFCLLDMLTHLIHFSLVTVTYVYYDHGL